MKQNSNYFTKDHEDAILKYCSTTDNRIRTELYVNYIEPAFSEMVDKIVFTYKFTNLPDIEFLRQDCKIWLTTILDKYDPNSGSKAFSYFSVITKNWFIHKVKKNAEAARRETLYEDIMNISEHENLIIHHEYEVWREQSEFWNAFWTELDSWESLDLKPNEEKVVKAITILMKDANNIEIFNKKAVYLYIREITGLNTKQIVTNLNKVKEKYRDFKQDWDAGKI
jgi:DNA-directed RNA polymerase specialized sigma subunit